MPKVLSDLRVHLWLFWRRVTLKWNQVGYSLQNWNFCSLLCKGLYYLFRLPILDIFDLIPFLILFHCKKLVLLLVIFTTPLLNSLVFFFKQVENLAGCIIYLYFLLFISLILLHCKNQVLLLVTFTTSLVNSIILLGPPVGAGRVL